MRANVADGAARTGCTTGKARAPAGALLSHVCPPSARRENSKRGVDSCKESAEEVGPIVGVKVGVEKVPSQDILSVISFIRYPNCQTRLNTGCSVATS